MSPLNPANPVGLTNPFSPVNPVGLLNPASPLYVGAQAPAQGRKWVYWPSELAAAETAGTVVGVVLVVTLAIIAAGSALAVRELLRS